MRGLMTGRRADVDELCKIPMTFMITVQNALAHAWRRLLEEDGEGSFTICGQEEDTITERLYMILDDIYSNEPDIIHGLSAFQTPVREGNLANRVGNKRDCQPDLAFRPLRGQLKTRSTTMAAIFVECKPIDSAHPIGSTYCKEGICRFTREDYAWAVDRAIMLGYVRNICALPHGLTCILHSESGRKKYSVEKELTLQGTTMHGDMVYCSTHQRNQNSATAQPITLHHLWLEPENPCEITRCRT